MGGDAETEATARPATRVLIKSNSRARSTAAGSSPRALTGSLIMMPFLMLGAGRARSCSMKMKWSTQGRSISMIKQQSKKHTQRKNGWPPENVVDDKVTCAAHSAVNYKRCLLGCLLLCRGYAAVTPLGRALF